MSSDAILYLSLPFASFFFHLEFSDMFCVNVIHVSGMLHGPWCLRLINNHSGSYISSMVDEDSHSIWFLRAFLVQYVPSGCSSSIQSLESFSGSSQWECIKPEWLQLTIYVLYYILFPIGGLWEIVELWIKWCRDGTWASVVTATLCNSFGHGVGPANAYCNAGAATAT